MGAILAGPKIRDQLGDCPTRDRMTPAGRDLAQRNQHEGAGSHTRMRQFRIAAFDTSVVIDDIEIERTRRIARTGHPSELGFNILQDTKQPGRRQRRAHARDRVDERWIGWIRPRLAHVETGLTFDRYSPRAERSQGGPQRFLRGSLGGREIGAKCKQDHPSLSHQFPSG
jgi:hypothetical protein